MEKKTIIRILIVTVVAGALYTSVMYFAFGRFNPLITGLITVLNLPLQYALEWRSRRKRKLRDQKRIARYYEGLGQKPPLHP